MGFLLWALTGLVGCAGAAPDPGRERFDALMAASGPVEWTSPVGEQWREGWFLDGRVGRVEPTAEGFELWAGPTPRDNAHHVVLWTQREFSGDLRLDFDYVRLDDATDDVNILYLFARGSGTAPYVEDLSAWRELRAEPRMAWYFSHVATYHISFAAFGDADHPGVDYIRARRYLPETKVYLNGTDFAPDNFDTGLFKPGVRYHFTVIRAGTDLFMRVTGPDHERLFHWDTSRLPRLETGRIGLRHMAGRAARYEHIEVRSISAP